MALLSAESRRRAALQMCRGDFMDPPFTWTKPQFDAAVAAADQWIEDNTAAFVAALPAGFRTNSNALQKAQLFLGVLLRRLGRIRAEED